MKVMHIYNHKRLLYQLILLDRDGVINKNLPSSVRTLSDFQILPGVPQAIRALNEAGFKVAIVTNQAVVGRGLLSEEGLDEIHTYMLHELGKEGAIIDRIYTCTDVEISPQYRRKPAPGMLLEAMSDFKVSATQTLMIGDALRDLQAAAAAKCDSLLVLTGHGSEAKNHPDIHKTPPLGIYKDLKEAVEAFFNPLGG